MFCGNGDLIGGLIDGFGEFEDILKFTDGRFDCLDAGLSGFFPIFCGHDTGVDSGLGILNDFFDLVGGLLDFFAQAAHFFGDKCEAFAAFSGFCGFQGGVEGEDIGFIGDFSDDFQSIGDFVTSFLKF